MQNKYKQLITILDHNICDHCKEKVSAELSTPAPSNKRQKVSGAATSRTYSFRKYLLLFIAIASVVCLVTLDRSKMNMEF